MGWVPLEIILKAELACGTSSVFRNWHQWDLELMAPGGGPWGHRRGCSVNGPGWWVHGTHAWPVCCILDRAAQPWTVAFSWISRRRTGQTPCSPSLLIRSTNLKAAYPISASSYWSRRGWKPSSAAWPISQSMMPTLWNSNKNSGYWSLSELPWLAILLCCLKRR